MTITVIILTKNEERHIARALASVAGLATRFYVIDSGSTDRTLEIAREAGAVVLENAWLNHATQFNWALEQLPPETEWVLRLDADEYLEPELAEEIGGRLHKLGPRILGVYVPRRMAFLGRRIRHGGVFPVWVLRLFRYGEGRCENRWMDEHIFVEGETEQFGAGELIDDNHNSLTWWTQKHNAYASREVVDLLNLERRFMPHETVANLRGGRQVGVKRWMKEQVYARLPGGARALFYFLFRYVLRLGFLDGREGAAFHVLQGFWYRYLVDAKMHELRLYMRRNDVDAVTAIRDVLGINVKNQIQ
jgi:glycosyltransferase involved in cell wall biosynthesis